MKVKKTKTFRGRKVYVFDGPGSGSPDSAQLVTEVTREEIEQLLKSLKVYNLEEGVSASSTNLIQTVERFFESSRTSLNKLVASDVFFKSHAMSRVTQRLSQSEGENSPNQHQGYVHMKLLERVESGEEGEMSTKPGKERTRKITLVGKYPKLLAQSLNLSELPKYNPEDRIWRESRSDIPDLSPRGRHEDFSFLGSESSRKISHHGEWLDTSRKISHHGNWSDSSRKISHRCDWIEDRTPRSRPLRLPPILLPPVYSVKPTPLVPRFFYSPSSPRGPITDAEWEELQECRYLRPGLKKFNTTCVS